MLSSTSLVLTFDIIPSIICVSIGQTDEEFKKLLKNNDVKLKYIKSLNKFYISVEFGMCSITPEGMTIIRVRENLSKKDLIGTIVHECTHATCYIIDSIGAKLSIGNSDEFYCYINDYLVMQILEKLEIV